MRSFICGYRFELITFIIFLVVALVITVLHLLFHPVRVLGMDTSIFYMDEKYTLAAFFSTVAAFLVGFLALNNIGAKNPSLRWWANFAFGLFFIGLAFDEYFEVHEYTNSLIKASIKADGIIKTLVNLSWIFPLLFVILAVFFLFLIKLKQSKPEVRLPIIIGSFCFIVVLIFELLGSATYGRDIYVYFVAIEEGMEMAGISFFLLATLVEGKLDKIDIFI